jgi:3-hydroxyacyl-CoA dehydrogenase
VVYDLGGNVLHIIIHTYRNIIDEEVANGILKSIDLAEKEKCGLIIGGNGKDFTVGANLGLVFFAAIEKNYKKISQYVSGFQTLTSRIKYSDAPIVVVPKGLSLGGGCEFALHSDEVLCHTETYMGLPEARAGLVPAGGGTKEMAVRLIQEGASPDNYVKILFNILEGKISKSAFEAIELQYLSSEKQIIRNKNWQLAAAKNLVSDLLEKGYQKPQEPVLCIETKSIFQHLEQIIQQREIPQFEIKLALQIANILCGGRSSHGKVSEQHFLDLEREAFLSQCGKRETLKRLKNILSRK